MPKKKIRLYRKIDMDLICLYKNPDFCLPNAMVKAIEYCVYEKAEYLPLPTPCPLSRVSEKVEFNIELPEDKELLDWFYSIPAGTRNDAVKNLVRGYLAGPVICSFVGNTDKDNVDSLNQITNKAVIDKISKDAPQSFLIQPDKKSGYPTMQGEQKKITDTLLTKEQIMGENSLTRTQTGVPSDPLETSIKEHTPLQRSGREESGWISTPDSLQGEESGRTFTSGSLQSDESGRVSTPGLLRSEESVGFGEDVGFDLFGAFGKMID